MNVVQRQQWTIASFLAWEERQERPWEFDGFQPVAMNGGTFWHDDISANLRSALKSRLVGRPCRPLGPNVKIRSAHSVRYPDCVVTCTRQPGTSTIVEAPVVVFEVLSPSTSRTDRIDKAREYLEIASIMRYLILEQDSVAATAYQRDSGAWRATTLTKDDALALPEIGISFPLAECYAGIEFDSAADGAT